MDNPSHMKTYGNVDLPEGTDERPLVTFALFAYNQEKYIREAVEGAFSQTYSPLEIILSDDCSSDRTFEIMQEMAAAYEGPHLVIARRSKVNRGLGRHLSDVAAILAGKYVVVAAGDDISLPERASEIVAMMQSDGSHFAESNYNRMTDGGLIEETNIKNDYSGNYIWQIVNHDSATFANGATAAYRSKFLRSALGSASYTIGKGFLYNEDILIALYAIATNCSPSKYQKAALVNYRISPISLSNFETGNRRLADISSLIRREAFRSKTRLALLDAALEIAEKYPRLRAILNSELIAKDRHRCLKEISASDPSVMVRLRGLMSAKDRGDFKIRLVRLPGLFFHAAARYVASKL